MGEKLPSLTPKKAIKAFERAGFVLLRQSGSHVVMVNETTDKQIVIPYHSKDIKNGLLISQIKRAGLTVEEFRKLL
ncbi:MAG: type II toxin-antitoxin system HicA family toxin [Ignavibacteriales bacterium]|nr:type II toxin-antitoxin system HicA family toxin [Ignavibacteriales bacterium]